MSSDGDDSLPPAAVQPARPGRPAFGSRHRPRPRARRRMSPPCVLVTGADSVETMAVWIGMLGYDFEVSSPPELVAHVRTLAARYTRAVQD